MKRILMIAILMLGIALVAVACDDDDDNGSDDTTTTETTTFWLAEDVGPVLLEYRVVVNGDLRETITDELTSYSLP